MSDIVLTQALPDEIATMAEAWVGCISGAMLERDYIAAIEAAGFVDLRTSRASVGSMIESALADPIFRAVADRIGQGELERAAQSVCSLKVEARRPLGAGA